VDNRWHLSATAGRLALTDERSNDGRREHLLPGRTPSMVLLAARSVGIDGAGGDVIARDHTERSLRVRRPLAAGAPSGPHSADSLLGVCDRAGVSS